MSSEFGLASFNYYFNTLATGFLKLLFRLKHFDPNIQTTNEQIGRMRELEDAYVEQHKEEIEKGNFDNIYAEFKNFKKINRKNMYLLFGVSRAGKSTFIRRFRSNIECNDFEGGILEMERNNGMRTIDGIDVGFAATSITLVPYFYVKDNLVVIDMPGLNDSDPSKKFAIFVLNKCLFNKINQAIFLSIINSELLINLQNLRVINENYCSEFRNMFSSAYDTLIQRCFFAVTYIDKIKQNRERSEVVGKIKENVEQGILANAKVRLNGEFMAFLSQLSENFIDIDYSEDDSDALKEKMLRLSKTFDINNEKYYMKPPEFNSISQDICVDLLDFGNKCRKVCEDNMNNFKQTIDILNKELNNETGIAQSNNEIVKKIREEIMSDIKHQKFLISEFKNKIYTLTKNKEIIDSTHRSIQNFVTSYDLMKVTLKRFNEIVSNQNILYYEEDHHYHLMFENRTQKCFLHRPELIIVCAESMRNNINNIMLSKDPVTRKMENLKSLSEETNPAIYYNSSKPKTKSNFHFTSHDNKLVFNGFKRREYLIFYFYEKKMNSINGSVSFLRSFEETIYHQREYFRKDTELIEGKIDESGTLIEEISDLYNNIKKLYVEIQNKLEELAEKISEIIPNRESEDAEKRNKKLIEYQLFINTWYSDSFWHKLDFFKAVFEDNGIENVVKEIIMKKEEVYAKWTSELNAYSRIHQECEKSIKYFTQNRIVNDSEEEAKIDSQNDNFNTQRTQTHDYINNYLKIQNDVRLTIEKCEEIFTFNLT